MDAELIFVDFEEKAKVEGKEPSPESLSKSEKIKRLTELVAQGEYKPDSEDTAEAILESLEEEGLAPSEDLEE